MGLCKLNKPQENAWQREQPIETFLDKIRVAARIKILITPHATRQSARPDRMITPVEIESVIFRGELIEEYPGDRRGHSALLLGLGDGGRPIHVTCSPKEDYLAVITAYLPDPSRWSKDFKNRIIK